MANRIRITASISPDGVPFSVSGQEARTLSLLVQKGKTGLVAYDFQGGPPFRLPAYCHSLIKYKDLVIETRRENHDGGWHGRFVLHTPVEILELLDPKRPSASAIAEAA